MCFSYQREKPIIKIKSWTLAFKRGESYYTESDQTPRKQASKRDNGGMYVYVCI